MKGYDPGASPAALASNWRRVLVVDALAGAAMLAAGVVLMVVWSRFGGAVLAALGVLYVFAIVRRFQIFKERREQAGLDA